MSTTAFISKFRSMTFECREVSRSSSLEFSEINSYAEETRIMAPQQLVQEISQKNSDGIPDSEQSRGNQDSSISSLGSSIASSSPVFPGKSSAENGNQNYAIKSDPSSDNSESIPNDSVKYNDQKEVQSPLELLQCALEKDGRLGQKIHLSNSSLLKENETHSSNDASSTLAEECTYYNNELLKCHLCPYTETSKHNFNIHMSTHFDHICPYCKYSSRTEGRLKRHIKDFHSTVPPESWAGTKVQGTEGNEEKPMDDCVSSSANGKSRTYRCKQCSFVAYKKQVFWAHVKTHIKAEKLLCCPECEFGTEYKHHLEYHIRNHYGSKPFQCPKCNYNCVNKSMLNSHMKSHSNIYQYRCSDCTYATKYCHSLKLHLRKYDHKPATVLNIDGTPNPYPVIDVYGTRRGPRTKKRKGGEQPMETGSNQVSTSSVVSSQTSMNFNNSVSPLLQQNTPIMYPQFFNNYHGNVFLRPSQITDQEQLARASQLGSSPSTVPQNMGMVKFNSPVTCLLCGFITDVPDAYQQHMILHAAKDNQDLAKLYGINSDSILPMQDPDVNLNSYLQNQRQYAENFRRPSPGASGSHDYAASNVNEKRSNTESVELKCVNEEAINKGILYAKNTDVSLNVHKKDVYTEFSPTNYQSISPSTSQIMQPNLGESSRNFIPSPVSFIQSQKDEGLADNNDGTSEHSPLDLSNGKGQDKNIKIQNDAEKPISVSRDDTSPSQCHSRKRRKGKAFKIDQYMQYEDQPMSAELYKSNQNHFKEFYQNGKHSPSDEGERKAPFKQAAEPNVLFPNSSGVAELTTMGCSTSTPIKMSSAVSRVEIVNGSRDEPCSPTSFDRSKSNQSPQNATFTPMPKMEADVEGVKMTASGLKWPLAYTCKYCDMAFKDCAMYTIHMGYHGFADPFICNMCGHKSDDKMNFFLHIARTAHQ